MTRIASIILLALSLASCSTSKGYDPQTGFKTWQQKDFLTNRGTHLERFHSQGSATINPFRAISRQGGNANNIEFQDSEGNPIPTSNADKFRFFNEAVVTQDGEYPLLSVSPNGMDVRGTQDQTRWVTEAGNVILGSLMIEWAGKTWRTLISETGKVVLRAVGRIN